MQAVVTLILSEANWDLYPEQAGDACVDQFTIQTPDGPWLQITYDCLCDQNGDVIAHYANGFWRRGGDNVYSDITIEFRA